MTPAWMRRVACISTSRADAGIYRPLVNQLAERYETSFLAGGTHTSAEFGTTIDQLDLPRSVRVVPVAHHGEGDRPIDVSRSAAAALERFSMALGDVRPDLVFVLGDRSEMLAATLAASIHGLPIAHLHGGDTTAGAYDDACRHAITKLSHIHFPATTAHADKIRLLGEADWRICTSGALALDSLSTFRPIPHEAIAAELRLNRELALMVVVFHPQTICELTAQHQIEIVLTAIAQWHGNILFLGSNADVGYASINNAIEAFGRVRRDVIRTASLSQEKFWSILTYASLLAGNSSAGLLEAPTLKLPVVNIGDRQKGRIRAANVVDVAFDHADIQAAIAKAASLEFRTSIKNASNPYGDGRAAERILDCLSRLPSRDNLLIKI